MAAQLHSTSPTAAFKWLSLSKLPTKLITRLLSVMISLVILTMASAAMAMLQEGDSGDAVRDLQNRLTVERCYNGRITAYFGARTKQAVMDCQAKLGLTVDGVVGPQTLAALDGFATPEAPKNVAKETTDELQNGSQGEKVIALQRQLRDLNLYEGAIDGLFGPKTEAAVVAFQRTNGLVQTGVFGALENKAIASSQPVPSQIVTAAPSFQPATLGRNQLGRNQLALGDAGRDVQRLQERLKELQLFDSAATGYFGDLTKSAVSSFQTSHRIPNTGVADGPTLSALGLGGQQANAGADALQTPAANQEAFNRSGFTNGSGFTEAMVPQAPVGRSNFGTANVETGNVEAGNRFVVIIPKRDGVNLNQVRQLVPEATEGKSSIGTFIQAGAFTNQKAAEQHSRMLQAYKLDARVAYR